MTVCISGMRSPDNITPLSYLVLPCDRLRSASQCCLRLLQGAEAHSLQGAAVRLS